MFRGFKKLKDVQPGEIIQTRHGDYALVTEYRTEGMTYYDGYLVGSGEALHMSGNEWVAVIDIDDEIINVSEFPHTVLESNNTIIKGGQQ